MDKKHLSAWLNAKRTDDNRPEKHRSSFCFEKIVRFIGLRFCYDVVERKVFLD